MKISSSHPFFWFGAGILFILVVHLLVSQFSTVNEKLYLANSSYKEAEQAKNIAERKDLFNQALSIYKDLQKEYSPDFGNGKLDYNLGNSYFQLGEYPKAVVHYLRSQNLMPRDENVQTNLNITLNKLNINNPKKTTLSEKIFFFHHRLSLPERLQLLTLFTLILFILGSFLIWYPFKGLKSLCLLSSALLFVIASSLFYTQFIAPSYGIITKANLLYKDAGTQYAKVLEEPLPQGTEVEVLDVVPTGKWIKVSTNNGVVGFIPYDSMEII